MDFVCEIDYSLYWTGQKINHALTCDITYTALRVRALGNTQAKMHLALQECAPALGSPFMCTLVPNHTSHNPDMVMP